jgi:transposase
MSNLQYSVGLDYHTSFVQVCILDPEGKVKSNFKAENHAQTIIHKLKTLSPDAKFCAGIEACCGATDLADELKKLGLDITLAHASTVARLKKSPDKSDYTDARMLADLVRVGWLPAVWLPDHSTRQLRMLVRSRQKLAESHKSTKLRITAMLRSERVKLTEKPWTKAWLEAVSNCKRFGSQGLFVINSLLQQIEFLKQQMKAVEEQMFQATLHDGLVQYLLTIKGIGLVTAVILRAELGNATRFNNGKQMAHYCGLSPCNASSGKKQSDSGLIHAANNLLRTTLIELAHRLVRYDERWQELYEKLKFNGKPICVAICAIANRFTRCLHHKMKEVEIRLEEASQKEDRKRKK